MFLTKKRLPILFGWINFVKLDGENQATSWQAILDLLYDRCYLFEQTRQEGGNDEWLSSASV
jgi:hypothetical protein